MGLRPNLQPVMPLRVGRCLPISYRHPSHRLVHGPFRKLLDRGCGVRGPRLLRVVTARKTAPVGRVGPTASPGAIRGLIPA
jgi:hypothetical protein